jgi:hypothetical protein
VIKSETNDVTADVTPVYFTKIFVFQLYFNYVSDLFHCERNIYHMGDITVDVTLVGAIAFKNRFSAISIVAARHAWEK